MEAEALRTELHEKIDYADQKQLEQLYEIVLNYLDEQDDMVNGKNGLS